MAHLRSHLRPLLALPLLLAATAGQAADSDDITRLMLQHFDRPDARLAAGPVVVAGDWAVADWSQGAKGGRALLHQQDGHWHLTLCGGDALRQAADLARLGPPEAVAGALAAALAQAEAAETPARLALIASFGDVMAMGGEAGQ